MDPTSHIVRRALRQAQLYGYLVARSDRLYCPGGNRPICSLHVAQEMARSGWLAVQNGRYEITPEGRRTAERDESPLGCLYVARVARWRLVPQRAVGTN